MPGLSIQARASLNLLFLSLALSAMATGQTLVDSLEIRYHFQGDPFELFPDTSILDTSLFLVQLNDPASRHALFTAGNGNTGSWKRPLEYAPQVGHPASVHSDVMGAYLLTARNLPLYRVSSPFTEAGYSMGAATEQLFRVTHAQNLGFIDAGITYRIISAPGEYVNQKAQHDSWGIYLASSPRVNRLSTVLSFTNSKVSLGENGGITSPSLFEDTLIQNRKLIDVNLGNAMSTFHQKELRFNVAYHLVGAPDSNGIKPFTLSLLIGLDRKRYDWDYRDQSPDTAFYPAVLRDSSSTHDTIRFLTTGHSLGLRLAFHGFVDLELSGGIQATRLHGHITGTGWDMWGIGPEVRASATRKRHLVELGFSHVVYTGELRYGSRLSAGYRLRAGEFTEFRADLHTVKAPLPFYALGWTGNHNAYALAPDTVQAGESGLGLAIIWKGLALNGNLTRYRDMLYFDDAGHPAFLTGTTELVRVNLEYRFEGEAFGTFSRIIYQAGSADSIMGIPDIAGYHSVWLRFPMFRSALMARAGIDLRYHSAYDALSYRADMAVFHTAAGTRIPAYLYADPWIAVKIRSVRFFAKLAHANAGLMGVPYYDSPGRPAADRRIIIGLNWIFYD